MKQYLSLLPHRVVLCYTYIKYRSVLGPGMRANTLEEDIDLLLLGKMLWIKLKCQEKVKKLVIYMNPTF